MVAALGPTAKWDPLLRGLEIRSRQYLTPVVHGIGIVVGTV